MTLQLPDEIELTIKVPTDKIVEIIEKYDGEQALPSEEYRMTVARRWARFHLGNSDWADQILNAYRHPGQVQRELDKEMSL